MQYDDLVEACLAKGWEWVKPFDDVSMLMPPRSDVRHKWCAQWIQYKPGYLIPHWADPRTVEEMQ